MAERHRERRLPREEDEEGEEEGEEEEEEFLPEPGTPEEGVAAPEDEPEAEAEAGGAGNATARSGLRAAVPDAIFFESCAISTAAIPAS